MYVYLIDNNKNSYLLFLVSKYLLQSLIKNLLLFLEKSDVGTELAVYVMTHET